jgi:hypothetical protein
LAVVLVVVVVVAFVVASVATIVPVVDVVVLTSTKHGDNIDTMVFRMTSSKVYQSFQCHVTSVVVMMRVALAANEEKPYDIIKPILDFGRKEMMVVSACKKKFFSIFSFYDIHKHVQVLPVHTHKKEEGYFIE